MDLGAQGHPRFEFKGSQRVLEFSKARPIKNAVPPYFSKSVSELTPITKGPILRGGQKEMKTVHALLLSFLLMAVGAFAQQQPTGTQQDSKTAATPKAVKKSVSKKNRKEKKEEKEVAGEAEQETLPPALSEHLKKLAQTVPVNGGLSSPGGLAHQEFIHRAYPDTNIPMARIDGARSGHAGMAGRNFWSDRPGQWESFGPSLALYPLTPLRNFSVYVPNAYPAASRTTALALSSYCQADKCTLWAGPAGGGIWRTRD